MLRFLTWTALLLGLLILGVYSALLLDLLTLVGRFGTGLIWATFTGNPHMIFGPACGMALVLLEACGFALRRR